ncbi:hypothetical protein KUL97_06565 [Synechococcus sp. HK05]|uniref:hypothetical protein n=1 Tax=Synechococcus sp. HK05 TaxID=2725975 RepID=UPI001C393065|nr:hypothetical protein [Synechococcus sp. HK05]MBV2351369.1 hypothetical protein [Synechococcus sp. HK05]
MLLWRLVVLSVPQYLVVGLPRPAPLLLALVLVLPKLVLLKLVLPRSFQGLSMAYSRPAQINTIPNHIHLY